MRLGDRARCARCGAKIVLVKHPHIISMSLGMWVHEGPLRRTVAQHRARGPLDYERTAQD